ncbi:MAG: alpha-glucosidase family protein [Pseudomonadota bacterium]
MAAQWWRGAVVYQIYPRSFQDSNGDGVGDLPGILRRLDYVADLGVDAVWISPFFTSPMHDFGYDVADFCNVDPLFGALADFDALIAKAHDLNLKVIIDQVYSHSSVDHPWFSESRASRTGPKADWYVWADPKADGTPPNNWQSLFSGPAWTWDGRRQQYYLHNFLREQPDLNLRHPEVQEAVLDIARFWLERGVDGFRLDAANFYMHDPALRDNPPARAHDGSRPYVFQDHLYNRSHPDIFPFIARLRQLMDAYEARFAVAEIGDRSSLDEVIAYTQGADRLHSAYSFVFLESHKLSADFLRRAVEAWHVNAGGAWPSWTFSNHDAVRAPSRWHAGEDPRFARLLNALLLSLRGTIFVYQGEELGLPQADVAKADLRDPEAIANWPATLGRDGARTPMPWRAASAQAGFSTAAPWLPVDPRHIALAVDRQARDSGSTLAMTRRLIALRRRHIALRLGDIHFLNAPEPVVAFERRHQAERLLCVFNLSDAAQSWQPADAARWQSLEEGRLHPEAGASAPQLPPFGGYIARYRI